MNKNKKYPADQMLKGVWKTMSCPRSLLIMIYMHMKSR